MSKPYYLYTNGVLKLVDREKPKRSDYYEWGNDSRFRHELNVYSEYITELPSIAVSDDLKAKWKEGDRPVEGKDFQLKLLTYYQFHGSATTGCFVGCSPERIDAGGCLCYSKHEYAVPPTLPVNTLQEEKESQDGLLQELYQDTYGSPPFNMWKEKIRSKYNITRKQQ